MDLYIAVKDLAEDTEEFVERKGVGHPDTLADALADHLSSRYANYTLDHFGAVLHHNFDKLALLGGASYVCFGNGYLTKPIRVHLNGRASLKFGGENIPVRELLVQWTMDFMKLAFPMIHPPKDLEFSYNLSMQSSPGKIEGVNSATSRNYWFQPRSIDDLRERSRLGSNDTSLGVGYAPSTALERIVLQLETTLNRGAFRATHEWIGSDIKVMAFRSRSQFSITACVPQIANNVSSITQYKANLAAAKETIESVARASGVQDLEIHLNTRDDFDMGELYLTAIGSSIESGDEGLVGRGNRVNGLISPSRPMSMEGACGKNPVYHVGKVYNLAAHLLSHRIYDEFRVRNVVYLASQSGRDLADPWKVVVQVQEGFQQLSKLTDFITTEVRNIPGLTKQILAGQHQLY